MKENGLELLKIKSKVEKLQIKDQSHVLQLFNSEGFVVAYLDYKVLIGRIKNNNFQFYKNETFEDKYIQRLRLFNKEKELLVWKYKDCLKGRMRIDSEGNETYVVDTSQMLWGTDKEELGDGWTRLFEERGPELIIPYKNVKIDNKKSRLFLKTRNYIDFHKDIRQATYIDCRFIEFTDKTL